MNYMRAGFRNCRSAILVLLMCAVPVGAQTEIAEETEEVVVEQAEPVTVERLSAYLNGLSSAWARFTQINSDGTLSNGTLVVKRPWRARLEYDPPDTGLIIASSRRIAIIDRKSNTSPQLFPLRRTPLYLLLKDHIDLTDERLDPRFVTAQGHSELHLQSPSDEYSGSLILSFRNEPLQLDGWTVIDEFGNRTHVRFDSLGTGLELSPAMFDIELEVSRHADDN